MGFQEDLARHADAVRARMLHVKGEEATKQALIVPLLQVLGYDVFDPREVRPEYIADFATKKAGQFEKIDYAIYYNGAPVLFIEAKPLGAVLEDHSGQLSRYFNATPSVRVAIITDGVGMRVFCDLQQPNIMDPSPWLEINLLSPRLAEIQALARLRKVDFASDGVVSLAEEMVFYNTMMRLLAEQILEPSDKFVRFVASEIPAVGRITPKVVERLTPILRKAVQSTIVDHVKRSFDQPSAAEPIEPTTPPSAKLAPPLVEPERGVETTADELAAFELIAGWIREAYPDAKPAHRDSASWFTIQSQQNTRKWCIRLNVTKAPMWAAFRHVTPDELRTTGGFVPTTNPMWGDSVAMLQSLGDISRLRTVCLLAYDREQKRVVEKATE